MSRRVRRLCGGLACGAALAVALSGCNSHASASQAEANAKIVAANHYLAQLESLGQRFRAADQRYLNRTAGRYGKSLPVQASAAPRLARAAATYAKAINALTPPAPSVTAPQARLAKAARAFAADLRRLATASSTGNVRRAVNAGRQASKLTQRIVNADAAVERAVQAAFGHPSVTQTSPRSPVAPSARHAHRTARPPSGRHAHRTARSPSARHAHRTTRPPSASHAHRTTTIRRVRNKDEKRRTPPTEGRR